MNSQDELRDSRTIQKCMKILYLFEQLEPRKFCTRPHSNKKLQGKKYKLPTEKILSRKNSVSSSKSIHQRPRQNIQRTPSHKNSIRKIFQNSSTQKQLRQRSTSNNKSFLNQGSVTKKDRSLIKNRSYSGFKKESRLEKIMKLKVKPTYLYANSKQNNQSKRQAMNSYLDEDSPRSNKENNFRHQQTRLDKIMNIKVNKPKVNSTLINYEPCHSNTSFSTKKKNSLTNSVIEMKQVKNKMKKVQKQQLKEDRLWKIFQRQRQLRVIQDRKMKESQSKQLRRRQKKFQSLVHRQVTKIECQKEIDRRKKQGFAQYVYPMY